MSLAPRHYGIILTGLATAILHISLYPDFGHLDWIVLNGFGTIALLGAYFLPIRYFQERHQTVYWSLVGYIALTILLWIIFGDKSFQFETTADTGYYAKLAELSLLAFLWADQPATNNSASRSRL